MILITIIAAAVAAFVVGALWYGLLFSRPWQAATGLSDDQLKAGMNMGLIFGLTFLLELAMATMLAHNFAMLGQPELRIKLMMTTGIALAFIIPAMAVNYLYLRKPMKLFLIDAGHWLFAFAAMGLVFGLMG